MTSQSAVISSKDFQARRWLVLLVGIVGCAFLMCLHISVGARAIPFTNVVTAFFNYDDEVFNHIVVMDLRLPRALIAILAGAGLSIAGAQLQAISKNPLADPGLLGLLAGASGAVVFFVGFVHGGASYSLPVVAAVGASVSGFFTWWIASRMPGGATAISLTLAGAGISAFLGALIMLMHLLNNQGFDELRVWLVGSLSGQSWESLQFSAPWFAVGFLIAFSQARVLTILAMGKESAAGLGVNPAIKQATIILSAILLTAAAVAVAGPLGFIGLVIPHVTRLWLGADYRWVIPFSALIGALYLLGIDLAARLLINPREVATGLLMTLVGAPLFIFLVTKKLRG